ncbi:hypothetical protein OAH95_03965 [Burkholderiaceae bacterium]|nr:hypothetical protein [Burkholderiaceae bacterium]
MFGGLVIGLLVTRMLLGVGQDVFGIYVTITVGFGVSIVLTELLRMGLMPVLGTSLSEGKVQNIGEFRSNLTAAFVVSVGAAGLGASAMVALGYWFLEGLGTPEIEDAAWTFLYLRIAMMSVIVTLTPAMSVLLVSARQPTHNMFLFLERLSEIAGVALPLWIFSDAGSYSNADRLVQFGAGISALTILTNLAGVWVAFAPGAEMRPLREWPDISNIRYIVGRIGWSSLQTISINLYARADVLIVASFLGPVGAVSLGIAIRLMGYVRQATIGLVSGLDATFANLSGQRKRLKKQSGKSDEFELKLLSLSTALQGGIVFQLGVLLLLLRQEIVFLWVGDLLEGENAAKMLEDISVLSSLMIIGIGFRSLNLGWMSAMTGQGNAKHFTPWLLPGAVGNAMVLIICGLYAPGTFSLLTVGWTFLGFQMVTHVIIIPIVSARSFGCRLQSLIEPLIVPFGIAVVTYFAACMLNKILSDVSNELRIAAVVLMVLLGAATSLLMALRCDVLK